MSKNNQKNSQQVFINKEEVLKFNKEVMKENKDLVNEMTTTNVVNSECYVEVPDVWEHVVQLSTLVEQLGVAADKFCSIQDDLNDFSCAHLCYLVKEFAPHASVLCHEINRLFKDIDPYSTYSVAEQIEFYENMYGFKIQDNKEIEEYLKNLQNTNN